MICTPEGVVYNLIKWLCDERTLCEGPSIVHNALNDRLMTNRKAWG